jgi:hypothetical protein
MINDSKLSFLKYPSLVKKIRHITCDGIVSLHEREGLVLYPYLPILLSTREGVEYSTKSLAVESMA